MRGVGLFVGIALVLVPTAMTAAEKGKVSAVTLSDDDFSHGQLVQINDERRPFRFDYWDFKPEFQALTTPEGGQGGGYSLESMVIAALEISDQKIAVDFDSEGDCFVAWGDKEELRVVARIVLRITSDNDYAKMVMKHAVARGYFE
ncbi:hypothetical protein PQU92_05170 [Asticcacaulis sp. BYS171W]|uniref:Uncharacterized protein n=1 Tax=Asticcacaulis aquaticus TaxID=2984212 RepID=A0ABT5HS38_9CAUL|nr:hypothetical protein [Asticcacaulis aquaticus]MDC7682655.1 hypothetical protein [Asticcacaulis aquaticus]